MKYDHSKVVGNRGEEICLSSEIKNFQFRQFERIRIRKFFLIAVVKVFLTLIIFMFSGMYQRNSDVLHLSILSFVLLFVFVASCMICFYLFHNVIFPFFCAIDSGGFRFGTSRRFYSISWNEIVNVELEKNSWFARLFSSFVLPKWVLKFHFTENISSFERRSAIKFPFFDFMHGWNRTSDSKTIELRNELLPGANPDELLAFAELKIAEARQTPGT